MIPAILLSAALLAAPAPEADESDTISYAFEARVVDANGFLAFPIGSPITGEFTIDKRPLKGAKLGKNLASARNRLVFRTPLGEFRATSPVRHSVTATDLGPSGTYEHFGVDTNAVSLPAGWAMAKPRNETDLSYSVWLDNSPATGAVLDIDHLDPTKFRLAKVWLHFDRATWPGGAPGNGTVDAQITSMKRLNRR